jgi:hypothetical protein
MGSASSLLDQVELSIIMRKIAVWKEECLE